MHVCKHLLQLLDKKDYGEKINIYVYVCVCGSVN